MRRVDSFYRCRRYGSHVGRQRRLHFYNAGRLTSDGKYVYIADGTSEPYRTAVRRLNLTTLEVDTIAGSATMFGHVDGAAKSSLFSSVQAVATDGVSLFIADPDSTPRLLIGPTIRQIDLKTMTVSTMIGTPGQESFAIGLGKQALVNNPWPIVLDAPTHSLVYVDLNENVVGAIA